LSSATFDRTVITKLVIEQVEELGTELGEVTLDAPLEGLGLDSLDIVELGQRVRRELGITVAAKDFVEARTVGDVVGVITQKAAQAEAT
jgi:acyl carrier protein